MLVRGPPGQDGYGISDDPVADPMPQADWRPRVVAPSEVDIAPKYKKVLDALVSNINKTAVSRGYALSYAGDMRAAMDCANKHVWPR